MELAILIGELKVVRDYRWHWVLLLYALSQASMAQLAPEQLRLRIEQLRETGTLQIDDVSIAAVELIPDLYERRTFSPTWTRQEQVTGLIELVEESSREGLDPDDYHYAAILQARQELFGAAAALPGRRAELDLILTDSLIRVGYHLRFGKVNPADLDPEWNFDRELLTDDPVATIQAAIDSDSLSAFRSQLMPRGVFYERLQEALAEYRAIEATGGWPLTDPGPTLRPGANDARVPSLARRLLFGGDLSADYAAPADNRYDALLEAGVRSFQERHGLDQDGAVGPATLAALNIPVEQRIEQLRANLERTRWVFEDLEDNFIIVNIASFRAYVVRDGDVAWTTRVQVGTPYRKTPIFKSSMKYLVFNPTWTVPPTILRQDILPRVRENPGYLASKNMEVIDNSGTVIDPFDIDWPNLRGFPYRLVQGPGPTNALGLVKFIFPNEHFVFLHDTPSQALFERQDRAFSSGCIRVESPFDLASLLLGEEWDLERIDAVIQSEVTQTVFLEEPLTVMLLYWTTEVDDGGRVFFLPDVYARDQAVIDGLQEPYSPGVLSVGSN